MTQDMNEHIARFMALSSGHIKSMLLILAGRLGLGDLLREGPLTAGEIAARTGCSQDSLERFLRGMAAVGILRSRSGAYDSTPLLEFVPFLLAPGFDETGHRAWAHAQRTMQSGEPGWVEAFGKPYFSCLDENRELSRAFDQWNTDTCRRLIPVILDLCDFTRFSHVADLGGGQGLFLAEVLKANPGMQGTLFDRPEVVKQAGELLVREGVEERVEVIGGDIFQDIPDGPDAYLLSRVLLNWGDEQALSILSSCRRGMGAQSKLLIMDILTTGPEHPAHRDSIINDLNLFVIWGGGSRTEKEWRELVTKAGLRFETIRCAEPPSTFCVIEARPGNSKDPGPEDQSSMF